MNGPRIGNGRLDAIQSIGPITLADTTQPCIALQWTQVPVRGEKQTVQRHNATIAIDANGSADSKLLISIAVKRKDFDGTDLADLTYAISVGAAKVDWSSTTASGTATAVTFADVADLISELPGFNAWVLNAPLAASVNSDDFIDLAATAITTGTGPGDIMSVLYRDVSTYLDANGDLVMWKRIGLPEVRDRNALRLFRVEGAATGVTNGIVTVYQDTKDGAQVYLHRVLGSTTVHTSYIDRTIENADTVRGPLILEVRSDDVSAASFFVGICQAQIGA